MNDVSTRPAAPKGELPDMGYIRDHVPVEDVMRALGIHVEGQRGRCPFVENHAHGDRTPSLSFFRNKVKCHGCNTPLESSIDYVARYKHCSATDAARWIAGQFSDVPTIAAKRQKPAGAPPTPFPLWMYDRGYIASLPPAYVVLAGALFERSEGDAVEVSYLTL